MSSSGKIELRCFEKVYLKCFYLVTLTPHSIGTVMIGSDRRPPLRKGVHPRGGGDEFRTAN